MIEIREYLTPSGSSPFGEWLLNLRDRKAKAKILTRLDRVAAGNLGDHKYLRDAVYELRLTYGKGIRIYYGKEGDTIILLLCGGDKSTQSRDIKKAVEYWQEHTGE
ncbi:MAG: type II toxin-antitoxin system RelE/ParE family toxin [Pseudomonadota bacterium]